jgi:hypothetical protein
MDLQHETPCFYDVPQSVQPAKALAADERDTDKENLVDARESLGAKWKISMNYFVRGRMTEEHAQEVYYSNRTMTASESMSDGLGLNEAREKDKGICKRGKDLQSR